MSLVIQESLYRYCENRIKFAIDRFQQPPEESELERVSFDGNEENSSEDLTAKTSLSKTDLLLDESKLPFSYTSKLTDRNRSETL